jgi:hypothetical protein
MISPEQRSPALRSYHKRKLRFELMGLTARGQRRQRAKNFTTEEARLESQRKHGRLKWQRRAFANKLAGLTTRGGEPIYQMRFVDRLILKSEIDAVGKAIAEVFDELPASAQTRCLALSETLATIRRRTA